MNVYPILLNNLRGRRCVVIGGGHEARRKTEELVDCEADVVVITPDAAPWLDALHAAGAVRWTARPYQRGDLRDAFLAIVTETNPAATAPIWEEAQEEKVLLNAMDDVPHCTFVAGSVVRRGPLVITISTSGCAPALSVRLRQQLEAEFGPAYGVFLTWMRALRTPMAAHFPDFEERRARWYALVDSDVLALLRQEAYDTARLRVAEIAGAPVAAALRLPAP